MHSLDSPSSTPGEYSIQLISVALRPTSQRSPIHSWRCYPHQNSTTLKANQLTDSGPQHWGYSLRMPYISFSAAGSPLSCTSLPRPNFRAKKRITLPRCNTHIIMGHCVRPAWISLKNETHMQGDRHHYTIIYVSTQGPASVYSHIMVLEVVS